jgi:hypothetical protein
VLLCHSASPALCSFPCHGLFDKCHFRTFPSPSAKLVESSVGFCCLLCQCSLAQIHTLKTATGSYDEVKAIFKVRSSVALIADCFPDRLVVPAREPPAVPVRNFPPQSVALLLVGQTLVSAGDAALLGSTPLETASVCQRACVFVRRHGVGAWA